MAFLVVSTANKHLPQNVLRRISQKSELRPFTIAFLFRQSLLLA